MARMRSVKPEYWTDEDLALAVSRDARLLYVALWNLADEHSRLRGNPNYIKGQVFPYDDDLTPEAIDALIGELASAGKVHRYRVGKGQYLFLPNLARHQRLETEKVPSRLPSPDGSEPDPGGPETGADSSESRANKSAPGSEQLSLKHVAGGREHVVPPSAGAGKPRAKESATASKAGKPRTPSANAGDVIAAYVEGAHDAGLPRPSESLRGRVGKQANTLLAEGATLEALVAAARSMGAAGWNDLAVQIQRDAVEASERASPRRSTTDDRVAQAQALKRELRAAEPPPPDDSSPPLKVIRGDVA